MFAAMAEFWATPARQETAPERRPTIEPVFIGDIVTPRGTSTEFLQIWLAEKAKSDQE